MKRYFWVLGLLLSAFVAGGACKQGEACSESYQPEQIEKMSTQESETKEEENFSIIPLNDTEAAIYEIKHIKEKLVIPKKINGYTITKLGYDDDDNTAPFIKKSERKKLKKLVMPDSIVSIGDNTFENCYHLSEVIWSKQLKSIGFCAFSMPIKRKTSFNYPDFSKIEKIGEGAFSNTVSKKTVLDFKKASNIVIESDAFSDVRNIKKIIFPTVLRGTIGCGFHDMPDLEIIYWPAVKGKGTIDGDFSYCNKLKRVVFPNRKTEIIIQTATFLKCPRLKQLVIPEKVTKVTVLQQLTSLPVMVLKGENTKLGEDTNIEFEGDKHHYNYFCVDKILVPKKSKAIPFLKKARTFKSLKQGVDHDSLEYSDRTKVKYQIVSKKELKKYK